MFCEILLSASRKVAIVVKLQFSSDSKVVYFRKDGVHWFPEVVRLITQTLVGHVAKSWGADFDRAVKQRLKKM